MQRSHPRNPYDAPHDADRSDGTIAVLLVVIAIIAAVTLLAAIALPLLGG